jgi:hypothetical protein
MSEPTRWLDGGAPGDAHALLRAGLEERPSRQSLQRTLVAVSATAVTSTAMGGALGATAQVSTVMASALGATAPIAFVAKCAAVGVVSASVMLGTVVGIRRFTAQSSAQPTRVATESRSPSRSVPGAALVQKAAVGNASPSAINQSSPPVAAAPDTLAVAEPERPLSPVANRPAMAAQNGSAVAAAARARQTVSLGTAASAQPELALAQELAFVDVARIRLRSGDATGALEQVNEYERHPGFGRFAPEALYLRMEAQLQLGNRLAAAAAARDILARYPRAPQVRRATSILETLGQDQER